MTFANAVDTGELEKMVGLVDLVFKNYMLTLNTHTYQLWEWYIYIALLKFRMSLWKSRLSTETTGKFRFHRVG